MELHVRVDTTVARRTLANVSGSQLRAAINRSLNRAARSTVQLASKTVRDELNVTAAQVKSSTTLQRAGGQVQAARIRFKGKAIPLSGFRGTRQTRRGLSVKVFKRGARKLLRGRFLYPGPFGPISAERQREGDRRVPRGPVELLFGPGVAQFLSRRAILAKLKRHARERFRIEFDRDLEHRMRRARERKIANAAPTP